MALRLGHATPEAFTEVTVSRGVEESILRHLIEGRLPTPRRDEAENPGVHGDGLILEPEGVAREVYSYLSNGSILAVEVEN